MDHGDKILWGQSLEPSCTFWRRAPNKCRLISRKRKQRQRARGQEALVGNLVIRSTPALAFNAQAGYHAKAVVVEASRLDTGKRPDRAVCAICAHEQPCCQCLAVRQREDGPRREVHLFGVAAQLDRAHFRRGEHVNAAQFLQAAQEHCDRICVLNHVGNSGRLRGVSRR